VPIDLTQIISKNLVRRRKAAGLSVDQAAIAIGASKECIEQWEACDFSLIRIHHLVHIAKTYKCPIGTFYMGCFTEED